MTIKTILLHAPAGHADPSRGPAAWALGLAAAVGAQLTALVFDTDATTGGPAEARRAPRIKGEATSQAAHETAERLLGAAADLGVEARAVTNRSFAYGLPEIAADHARLHDLVVAGTDPAGLLSERAMAEHLIFEAGRPVLVVPASYSAPFRCDRIVVAWDNSRSAARALGDSVPLLVRAGEVLLVAVGEEKAIGTSLRDEDLVAALGRRGIVARPEHILAAGAGIGEALGRHAVERGADLLVMGAFGHSRLRDFVLGGATRSLLDAPRLPILMAH